MEIQCNDHTESTQTSETNGSTKKLCGKKKWCGLIIFGIVFITTGSILVTKHALHKQQDRNSSHAVACYASGLTLFIVGCVLVILWLMRACLRNSSSSKSRSARRNRSASNMSQYANNIFPGHFNMANIAQVYCSHIPETMSRYCDTGRIDLTLPSRSCVTNDPMRFSSVRTVSSHVAHDESEAPPPYSDFEHRRNEYVTVEIDLDI